MLEKEKILHFSLQKFLSDGMTKVTMDEIARDLKISKKTIYKHFPTKSDLIYESLFNMTEIVKKQILEIVNGSENSIEKFLKIGSMIFSLASKFTDKWIEDLRTAHYGLFLEMDKFRTQAMMQNLRKIVEQGKQEGNFIDKPTELMLTIFVSSIRGVINPDFLYNANISASIAARETFDVLLGGMLTKQGRKTYKQLKTDISL